MLPLHPTDLNRTRTGGQNVNKVATGVQMRFNVIESLSLPETVKERLIKLLGSKLTATGDFIIKATRYRTQLRPGVLMKKNAEVNIK